MGISTGTVLTAPYPGTRNETTTTKTKKQITIKHRGKRTSLMPMALTRRPKNNQRKYGAYNTRNANKFTVGKRPHALFAGLGGKYPVLRHEKDQKKGQNNLLKSQKPRRDIKEDQAVGRYLPFKVALCVANKHYRQRTAHRYTSARLILYCWRSLSYCWWFRNPPVWCCGCRTLHYARLSLCARVCHHITGCHRCDKKGPPGEMRGATYECDK